MLSFVDDTAINQKGRKVMYIPINAKYWFCFSFISFIDKKGLTLNCISSYLFI